jgi:AmmeMemoRadiSam system protein B
MSEQVFSDVRPSPIAGQWYPGTFERLAATVDSMLDHAPSTDVPGQIIGLIAPHAGYIYSGPTAACAFKLVRGMDFERVVVVSPMHHPYFEPVLTTAHQAYQTPLGLVPVDQEALTAIGKRVPLKAVRRDLEHSLEIELPFLQRALSKPFSLIPLMLRDQSYQMAEALGKAIAAIVGTDAKTLLVASSDLSHFYPDAKARQLDRIMLERVAAFDPQGVIRVEDEGLAFACGRAAIATILVAARALGADGVQIVGYATSADTAGDTSQVVGYGAAVVYRSQQG